MYIPQSVLIQREINRYQQAVLAVFIYFCVKKRKYECLKPWRSSLSCLCNNVDSVCWLNWYPESTFTLRKLLLIFSPPKWMLRVFSAPKTYSIHQQQSFVDNWHQTKRYTLCLIIESAKDFINDHLKMNHHRYFQEFRQQ